MESSPAERPFSPPVYSSQYCDSPGDSFSGSNEDMHSPRSQSSPSPLRLSNISNMPRHSLVQLPRPEPEAEPESTPRRRHASLPPSGSSTLRYHYVRGSRVSLPGPAEPMSNSIPSSLAQTASTQVTMRPNPTNYVSLSRKSTSKRRTLVFSRTNTSIIGNYTVNPYLHVPTALLSLACLPSTIRDDTSRHRKNLKFDVENGGIDVNIFLVGEPVPFVDDSFFRTTLDLKIKGEATTFPLIAKVHTPELPRPPFHLTASGTDGYHAIHIPASFHGLVTIAVSAGDLDTHISLSRGFFKHSCIMNETADARSYFVGEVGGWSRDKQGWDGDRIDVTVARGMVRLQYLGEKDRDGFRKFRWRFGI